MKKILNYKLLTVLAVLLISVVSCTKDFETINKNDNRPSADQAAPEMLLTNCIEVLVDRVQNIDLGEEIGNGWIQQHAKVQYTDEDRYRPRSTTLNNTWTSLYANSGMDAQAIINYATANGADYDNYKAAAIILKVYIMSVLTDLYGDIPYTEAHRGRPSDGGIINPKYDTQESIYTDLLLKLTEATALLDDHKAFLGDMLYSNGIAATTVAQIGKWEKFANSLRLRLLLRISDRNPALVTAEMTNMVVTSAANFPIFTSNADNAALVYLGSFPNNNPIHENRKTRDDHRVSKTIVDVMWTNNTLIDWRILAYAELPAKNPNNYVGMPNGLPSDLANNYLGNGLDQTSKLGAFFTAATAPGVLMSYAELQFILAEAVQRGFIVGSATTAQQYYEAGILASYNQFATTIEEKVVDMFSAANLTTWFGSATPTIQDIYANYLATDGAWVAGQELNLIGREKWLAGFDQGLQTWFDWRRTNIPALVPVPDAFDGLRIPQRLMYPPDEFSRNKVNVDAAVAIQGVDHLETRVWWDVANNF